MPNIYDISASTGQQEEMLFRSVLVYALADATRPLDSEEKREALAWFTEDEHQLDVEEICDYAGVDPSLFRQQAAKIIARGDPVSTKDDLWTILRSV